MLPPLPPSDPPWAPVVHQAYNLLQNSYLAISRVLHQEENDALRLNFHVDRVQHEMIPLLEALEKDADITLPAQWLEDCVLVVGHLSADIAVARTNIVGG
jgi:hypothetical protein